MEAQTLSHQENTFPQEHYSGKDRRIHRVYLTKNTEYHLRRDVCVAVRDRCSGAWISNHAALHRRVSGSIEVLDQGGVVVEHGLPRVGACICFDMQGLVTSRVEAASRPPRAVVERYYSVIA